MWILMVMFYASGVGIIPGFITQQECQTAGVQAGATKYVCMYQSPKP